MAPDCWMSSALPAATPDAASTRRIVRAQSRAARSCAAAAPMFPAPRMAIMLIGGGGGEWWWSGAGGYHHHHHHYHHPTYCNSGMDTLAGKVAVVTGASRGIGYATAAALVERGASVAISGTNQ